MFPLNQFGRRRKGMAGVESGGGGGVLGFRPEEDDGPDRWDPPVSDSEGAHARAAADWADLGRGEREREGFGPKEPKEDFLKPFSI